MKKTIYTLFVMLLVGGLVSLAQIKPITRQHSTMQKTEKTSNTKQSSSPNNRGYSKKPNKNTTQQSSSASNRSSQSSNGMSQAQKKRIIRQAIDNMVYVTGGTFMMGATSEQESDAFSDEKPAHQVTLSGYYIGKYEVTQELWQAVMDENPSNFKGNSRRPVERVSWNDCQEFITKLNRITGRQFRLPSEAEWEYAARGGNKSRGYKYAGSNTLSNVAWYTDNSGSTTHPVGQKSPNELGLFDMSGNVCEWCQDWKDNSYSSVAQTNPSGPSYGSYRVYRGGSWCLDAWYCRVSFRSGRSLCNQDDDFGLRLAI